MLRLGALEVPPSWAASVPWFVPGEVTQRCTSIIVTVLFWRLCAMFTSAHEPSSKPRWFLWV